jgi:hypothetical protein
MDFVDYPHLSAPGSAAAGTGHKDTNNKDLQNLWISRRFSQVLEFPPEIRLP